jgi:hypothetical protein
MSEGNSYVFTPYGTTLAYGRAELIQIMGGSGLTSTSVKNWFGSNYNISANTWNKLFGSNNPVYDNDDEIANENGELVLPVVGTIARLKKTKTIVVDLLSVDVVMQIMLQMEKALNASTNAYKLFTNKYNSGTQESTTAATMRSIYKSYFNDGTDLSLYDIQAKSSTSAFANRKIQFTSRLGSLDYERNETLQDYINGSNTKRNDRSLPYYASEFGVEMLQNSLLQSVSDSDSDSDSDSPNLNGLSCGFSFIKESGAIDAKVLNIRIYFSYVFANPTSPSRQIAISSGVNLFDIIDIKNFQEGVSSTALSYLLTDICKMINGDNNNSLSFTPTNTTWEYGLIANFNSLKCIYSDTAPYWSQKLISECYLRNSTLDIPRRMYYIIEYLNSKYSSLENGQKIIIAFSDGGYKIVSVVRILIDKVDNEPAIITFQSKDAQIDNLFPVYNVKSDTIISGELMVENIKGDTFMQVDPVTSSVSIAGKLGINQELHEIKGMVDIDNLSSRNMKQFIDQFAPLIRNTIENMDTFIQVNPFTSIDQEILNSSVAGILPLKIYTTEPVPIKITRQDRLAALSAGIEIPVRMFIIADAQRTKNIIDISIVLQDALIHRLHTEHKLRESQEAERRKWAVLAEVGIALVYVGVAGFVVATGGSGSLAVVGITALIETSKIVQAEVGSVKDAIEDLSGYSLDQLNEKITAAGAKKTALITESGRQAIYVTQLQEEYKAQLEIVGLNSAYEENLTAQNNYMYGLQFLTLAGVYLEREMADIITAVNEIIDQYNENGPQTNAANLPAYTVSDTYETDISNYKTLIDDLHITGHYLNKGTYKQKIDALLDEINMENIITLYGQTVRNISSEETRFIATMRNYSGYTTANRKAIEFLSNYNVYLTGLYNATRADINYQENGLIAKEAPTQTNTTRTSEQIITLQSTIDYNQKEYDKALFTLEAYTWLLDNYGYRIHENAGDHHYLSLGCRIDDKWKYEYHLRDMVIGANGVREAQLTDIAHFSDSMQGYGDILQYYVSISGDSNMKLNRFSAWDNRTFLNLKTNQQTTVDTLKTRLDTSIDSMNAITDALQDFTRSNDFDAKTHNLMKSIITNLYKMYTAYPTETLNTTQAIVLPVTVKEDGTTSILYLKTSVYSKYNLEQLRADVDNAEAVRLAAQSDRDNANTAKMNHVAFYNSDVFVKWRAFIAAYYDYIDYGNSSDHSTAFDKKWPAYNTALQSAISQNPSYGYDGEGSYNRGYYTNPYDATLVLVLTFKADGLSLSNASDVNFEDHGDILLLNPRHSWNDELPIKSVGIEAKIGPSHDQGTYTLKSMLMPNIVSKTNRNALYYVLYTTIDGEKSYVNITSYSDLTVWVGYATIFEVKETSNGRYYFYCPTTNEYQEYTSYSRTSWLWTNIDYFARNHQTGPNYFSNSAAYTDFYPILQTAVDNKNTALGTAETALTTAQNALTAAQNTPPTLTLSGRSLNVDIYTRDQSYRDILLNLITSLTASTQLVNYSTILFKKDNTLSISERIQSDALFTERFGSPSLFVLIDNITEKNVVLSEEFPHWNGKESSGLLIPGTNIKLDDVYAGINKAFIAQYGFNPTYQTDTNVLIENMYIVPYKYDDQWKLGVMRYYKNGTILYRIWCSIEVNDYISQSIITRGDSTLYGDLTLKSVDETEIFHIDTLNKIASNMYPLGIGTNQPKTMLDIQDTSIFDVTNIFDTISTRLNTMNGITISDTSLNDTTIITNLNSSLPSSISTDDYYYVYKIDMATKVAGDVKIMYHGTNSSWIGKTYTELLNNNIDLDNSEIISKYILPSLQKTIDETLFYNDSIYTTLVPYIYGLKYSINKVISITDTNEIYIVGSGLNIQQYNINAINNPNVALLFEKMDELVKYVTYTKYKRANKPVSITNTNVYNGNNILRFYSQIYSEKENNIENIADSEDQRQIQLNGNLELPLQGTNYIECKIHTAPEGSSSSTLFHWKTLLLRNTSPVVYVLYTDDLDTRYYLQLKTYHRNESQSTTDINNATKFEIKYYRNNTVYNDNSYLIISSRIRSHDGDQTSDTDIDINALLNNDGTPKDDAHISAAIETPPDGNQSSDVFDWKILLSPATSPPLYALYMDNSDTRYYLQLKTSGNGSQTTTDINNATLLKINIGSVVTNAVSYFTIPKTVTLNGLIDDDADKPYFYTPTTITRTLNYGIDNMTDYINLLNSRDSLGTSDTHTYTMVTGAVTYLDNLVGSIKISQLNSGVTDTATREANTLLIELHTSFMVQYFKLYDGDNLATNNFGVVSTKNNNHNYITYFYKYADGSNIKIDAFYMNITDKFLPSSVSLNGDMTVSGSLNIHGKNDKYITIDPENQFFGINTNDRFINYSNTYGTTSSVYNTQRHGVAYSTTYPNFSFERVSETPEDPSNPSYTRFGSYSASTMVRVSKLWNYNEIMERVNRLNVQKTALSSDNYTIGSLKTYSNNNYNWKILSTYGPDISFEVTDNTGLTTELGQLKMVIDKKDASNNLHAGFGVQVVDSTLSSLFEISLKNILYVNNDSQLFVEGVWLGGKLLYEKDGRLIWGETPIILEQSEPFTNTVVFQNRNIVRFNGSITADHESIVNNLSSEQLTIDKQLPLTNGNYIRYPATSQLDDWVNWYTEVVNSISASAYVLYYTDTNGTKQYLKFNNENYGSGITETIGDATVLEIKTNSSGYQYFYIPTTILISVPGLIDTLTNDKVTALETKNAELQTQIDSITTILNTNGLS